jgi:hypothetical protein
VQLINEQIYLFPVKRQRGRLEFDLLSDEIQRHVCDMKIRQGYSSTVCKYLTMLTKRSGLAHTTGDGHEHAD